MLYDASRLLYSQPIEQRQNTTEHSPTDILFAYALVTDRPCKYLVDVDVFQSPLFRCFYEEFRRGGYAALSQESRQLFSDVATAFIPPELLEIERFAEIVQNVRARNVAAQLAAQLSRESERGTLESIRSLLVEAGQRLVSGVGSAHSLPDILRDVQRLARERSNRAISPPYAKMVRYVPYLDSDYVVVGARTSVGKTSFALDWVRRLDVPSYILSMEMSRYAIATRFYAMVTKQTYADAVRNIRLEDIERLQHKYNVFINDSSNVTGEHLPLLFSEAHAKGARVFILDYIQMMYMHGRQERRDLEIGRISSILRDMSKKYNMPVIVLAQLNRLVEMRSDGKPRLSDLRDSGSLEMDADIVLLLSRSNSELEVNIAKNRNGSVGTFELYFDSNTMRFYEEPYELHGF